jgi:exonuclease III
MGTLNINSLKIVRKRLNILRQLKSHCDATCFQESKLDGVSANDVCKDDSGSWAFNNRTTMSGGVAIHLQEKLGQYTDDDEFNNDDGSVVGRLVEFNGYKLYLVSDYAPCCGKSKTRLAANMAILNEVEKLVINMKALKYIRNNWNGLTVWQNIVVCLMQCAFCAQMRVCIRGQDQLIRFTGA